RKARGDNPPPAHSPARPPEVIPGHPRCGGPVVPLSTTSPPAVERRRRPPPAHRPPREWPTSRDLRNPLTAFADLGFSPAPPRRPRRVHPQAGALGTSAVIPALHSPTTTTTSLSHIFSSLEGA